jgi:hypothetical protein
MLLSLYTWNGNAINDITNYKAWIPRGQILMPEAESKEVKKADAAAEPVGVDISGKSLTICIECKGATKHTQRETVKAWFADQVTFHNLVVKDTADSSRQWYVEARPTRVVPESPGLLTITLAIKEPIWKTVATETETTWQPTASGQSRDYTIDVGNLEALPIYEITPTTGKSAIITAYRRHVVIHNPKTWAMWNYAECVTGGGLDTAALINDTSVSNQINDADGITAGDETIDIDTAVGGGLPASGMGYCGTEQLSWTANSGTQLTGCVRGINGTTAAAHANNTVIATSRIQADGDDIRVWVDGKEVHRWITGMNSAATLVWIVIDFKRKREFKLATTLDDSSDYADIAVTGEQAMKCPEEGWLLIGTEVFHYTSTEDNYFSDGNGETNIQRGCWDTTKAAHAIGATVYWIEHEIQVNYGNQTMTDPAVSDEMSDYYDDDKPMLDLANCTNVLWTWTEFWSSLKTRTCQWKPLVNPVWGPDMSSERLSYTANEKTYAEPALEMGLVGGLKDGVLADDNYWIFSHPAGINTTAANMVFASGEKYNVAAAADEAAIKINSSDHAIPDPMLWTTWYTIPDTSVANTWQAWSRDAAVSGTIYHVELFLKTKRSNSCIEVSSVTLPLLAAGVPQVTMLAQVANIYNISLKLENTTAGAAYSINLDFPIKLNQKFTVNTLNHSIRLTPGGGNAFAALTLNLPDKNRAQWLKMIQGVNNIKVTETGLAGMDIVVKWQGRNN